MPVYNVNIYDIDPTSFAGNTGSSFVYAGPATADGSAAITDNGTGANALGFDDDNAGEGNTTGTVTIGGSTSTNAPVDAELVWTIRDTATGETFQIVQFDVESGAASGQYTLSEVPLVPGHTYEVVNYDTFANINDGDEAFTYADYQDNIVEGTSGDDTIDASYTGDPGADMIDGQTVTSNVFSWDALEDDGVNIAGSGGSMTVGGIDVTVSLVDEGPGYSAAVSNDTQYRGAGETFDTDSSILLLGNNNNGNGSGSDTSTLIIDFDQASGSEMNPEVENVTFRINDIDVATFVDTVTITAVDASGAPVTVLLTSSGAVVVDGDTATGATGTLASDADGSILVTIPGPVASIEIDYGNDGTGNQGIHVTDIHFDSVYIDEDDTVLAGDGNDTVDAGLGDDIVYGGNGDDILDGNTGNDTLYGEAGNDTLIGGDGDDLMHGGTGNDTFIGGAGADYNNGSSGQDTIDYSASDAGVSVDLSSNTYSGGDAEGDSGSGIDGVIGSDYDDTLIGYDGMSTDGANAYTNIFEGGAGNDYIDGAGGDDVLSGGVGNDTILGGTGNDQINGGAGADTIEGGAGNDTIIYGAGDAATGVGDTVYGGDGDDYIDDEYGVIYDNYDDYVDGGAGNDTIYTGGGDDTILGGSGNDTLHGEDGNDTIYGGTGSDTIYAGAGDDTIYAGSGDTIYGGDGNDTIIIDPSQLEGNSDPLNPDTITIIGDETGDGTGDVLDMNGLMVPGSVVRDAGDPESGYATLTDGTIIRFENIETLICFGRGTLIETPYGPRAIETLKAGDLVLTRDHGPQPLRWIGARGVEAKGDFAPIEIKSGALGNTRDLIVSPQHRMLLDGWRAEMLFGTDEVFAAAKHLINDKTILRRDGGVVEYFHMMFDAHEIVFAEGAPSESFHPSDMSLGGVADKAREELFTLFPELRTMPSGHGPTARQCLKAHEARLLIA